MTPIIEVKGLSKKYQIGEQQPYLTLRDSLASFIKNPFKKINAGGLQKNEFWALNDINFTVEPGEVVGIIGRNGAGKSTLLKILSRITPPTTGEITLRGRVGSLLEVGTGFQQELTGRENIYLNGAILGMSQVEIKRKFDEIVAFAEVEKFIDTPVKHYSSGMYMRLAFAVAAHLDPEILIVDEVLAVGDTEFQKKCLGKMDYISKNQGKTVLFVSHNLGAMAELCSRSIVLEQGHTIYSGSIDSGISRYLKLTRSKGTFHKKNRSNLTNKNQFVQILNAKNEYAHNDEVILNIEMYLPQWNDKLEIGIFPCDQSDKRIFMLEIPLKEYYSPSSPYLKLSVTLPRESLIPGTYSWETFIHNPLVALYDHQKSICRFVIIETGSHFAKYREFDSGFVYPPQVHIKKLEDKS